MKNKLPLALLSLLVSASACAQSGPATESTSTGATAPCGFYCWWSTQTNATQSKQPAWAVPLVTSYTGLFQVVRFDALRQIAPALTDTWNFDNSKGLNVIIPHTNAEVDVNLPPLIEHNSPKVKDGAGDFSVLGKWRLTSGNAQHGAYVLSVWALMTFPTGSYKNGSPNPSVVPTVGFGKGFGNFDVQSTLGITLPTGSAAVNTSGRPIAWNTAAQYKIGKLFWPEIESNATFYQNGTNNGKMQEFITPGLLIGKCGIHPSNPKSRPGLAFGAGMQIATSAFHTYNHELVMTARWIY
jgi:hypothetical protein